MAVLPIVRLFFPCAHIESDEDNQITLIDPKGVAFSRGNRNYAEELVYVFRDLRIERPGVIRFEPHANEVVVAEWELRNLAQGE